MLYLTIIIWIHGSNSWIGLICYMWYVCVCTCEHAHAHTHTHRSVHMRDFWDWGRHARDAGESLPLSTFFLGNLTSQSLWKEEPCLLCSSTPWPQMMDRNAQLTQGTQAIGRAVPVIVPPPFSPLKTLTWETRRLSNDGGYVEPSLGKCADE